MRIDRTAAAQADRLDAFWDRLNDPRPVSTDATSARDREEVHLETLVLYLESLKPVPSPFEQAATRARVRQSIGKETPVASPIVSYGTHADLRNARTRSRIVPFVRAFDRLAAAALILAVVAALVLLGPVRGLLDGDQPGRFAAILGLDANESTEQDIGSHSTMTLEVRPGDYEGGTVEVGFWEVTLTPGSAMSAPTSGDPISDPFGFSVSQGSVLFGGDDTWRPVEEGGSVGDLAGIDYVRNSNSDPAHLLVLAPMPPNAEFPLTIGAWPPVGAAASPVDGNAASETSPVLLSSVELDDTAAFQYRVMVSENILAPGMGIGDVEMFGPPESTLHAITVREGKLAIVPDESLATPEVTQELVPGDTVQVEADEVWSSNLRVTGSDNARVLGLLTMPAADNFTLDQTLESIAPFWGEWTVPESGEVNLAVRRLILQPGGAYRLPTDAGVLYHVASGTVDMLNSESGNTMNIAAGGTVAQNPGKVLSFSNPGSEQSALVQVVVSRVPPENVYQAYSRETLEKVSVEWLVQETETLSPGDVTLMLEVHKYNGENDGASAGERGHSLVLITSVDGEISVRRDGGDAEVVTSIGEWPVTPALGEAITIGSGGYLVAEPGAGWFVTGAPGAPSTGIVFTISPDPESGGTPITTPAMDSAGTTTLVGDPDACSITPLTVDYVNEIVATPSLGTTPLNRSLRGEERGTIDPATTEEIVAMLQVYTDCNATGDYTRIYAFYSDQSIRDSETIQDMVEAEHDGGEMPRTSTAVEDIRLFADGRAGARAVIDGEAAYLTFVYEDGSWKIDVWDDSNGGRVPFATPAS